MITILTKPSLVIKISESFLRKRGVSWLNVWKGMYDRLLTFHLNDFYHFSFYSLGISW